MSGDEDSNAMAVMESASEDESTADDWREVVDRQSWERMARVVEVRPTFTTFGDMIRNRRDVNPLFSYNEACNVPWLLRLCPSCPSTSEDVPLS